MGLPQLGALTDLRRGNADHGLRAVQFLSESDVHGPCNSEASAKAQSSKTESRVGSNTSL